MCDRQRREIVWHEKSCIFVFFSFFNCDAKASSLRCKFGRKKREKCFTLSSRRQWKILSWRTVKSCKNGMIKNGQIQRRTTKITRSLLVRQSDPFVGHTESNICATHIRKKERRKTESFAVNKYWNIPACNCARFYAKNGKRTKEKVCERILIFTCGARLKSFWMHLMLFRLHTHTREEKQNYIFIFLVILFQRKMFPSEKFLSPSKNPKAKKSKVLTMKTHRKLCGKMYG